MRASAVQVSAILAVPQLSRVSVCRRKSIRTARRLRRFRMALLLRARPGARMQSELRKSVVLSIAMRHVLIALVLALLTLDAVGAHDFWIEPSTFTPAPGEIVKLTLRVGEHLEGDTVPRNDAKIERFEAVGAGDPLRVVGMDGADPAGLIRPVESGGTIVVYRSLRSQVELDATKFAAYLELEGLPSVKVGPEAFSRCAKALIAVDGKGSPQFTKPVGLKLEIVPESDPYTLAAGAPLPVRVLFDGKPLRNVMVMALDSASAQEPQRIRTNAEGRARVNLPRSGMWLIKAVHMIPAPSDAQATWESFWASLTFRR